MQSKDMWKLVGVLSLGVLVLGGAGYAVSEDEDEDVAEAKAIYLDGQGGGGKPAMKFNVLLDRGGQERRVASTYTFRTGDRMKFEFTVNKAQYVYVLNRTISGEPERNSRYSGAKGISVVRDEDRRDRATDRSKYTLLFPTGGSGTNNKLAATKKNTVPTSEAWFRMDENPGIEKLYVVMSDKPIDIKKYFDLDNGKQRSRRTAGSGSSKSIPNEMEEGGDDDAAPAAKEADDVLDELNKDLADWSDNSDVVEAKGISVDGYGSSRNPARPMMVEVDLKHTRK